MMRTTTFLVTVTVALNLALAAAWAQQPGPGAPIATPAQASMLPPGAPIYHAGPAGMSAYPVGAYPVMPASLLLSDSRCGGCDSGCDSCARCDSCDGGGCDSCGGVFRGSLRGRLRGLRHSGLLRHFRSPFYGYYGGVEYMRMWGRGRNMPPLATTSPLGTPRDEAGVLGFDDTKILFGNESIGNDGSNGLRITMGGWLDPHESIGLGMRLTGIQGDSPGFNQSTFGNPILARPFFNTQIPAQDSLLASFPGVSEGSLRIETDLDMWAADSFIRAMVLRGCGYRVDFLGGYQYTRIDDGVTMHSVSTNLAQTATPGTTFDIWDSFSTRNTFNGGTVGFMTETYHGRWTVSTMGKIAFGNMHQEVKIRGRNIVTIPNGQSFQREGGLLTQPSNIGSYDRDEMAFVPEATITLSYALTCNIKCTLGYNFIYWSRAALAGDQIDLRVDPAQQAGLPGQFPAFLGIRDTDFWLMGGTVGLEGRF